jgi:hypothetical protein
VTFGTKSGIFEKRCQKNGILKLPVVFFIECLLQWFTALGRNLLSFFFFLSLNSILIFLLPREKNHMVARNFEILKEFIHQKLGLSSLCFITLCFMVKETDLN